MSEDVRQKSLLCDIRDELVSVTIGKFTSLSVFIILTRSFLLFSHC